MRPSFVQKYGPAIAVATAIIGYAVMFGVTQGRIEGIRDAQADIKTDIREMRAELRDIRNVLLVQQGDISGQPRR